MPGVALAQGMLLAVEDGATRERRGGGRGRVTRDVLPSDTECHGRTSSRHLENKLERNRSRGYRDETNGEIRRYSSASSATGMPFTFDRLPSVCAVMRIYLD